ncbi:MAG: hypothetical protein V4446_13625 [Pseudomonadota bacterium]
MRTMRTIGTKELDEFIEVLQIVGDKTRQMAEMSLGAAVLVNATAATGQLDAALETGLTAGAIIRAEHDSLLTDFERQAENCMGECRHFAETPARFFERIASMSAAEILSTMRSNGILVKGVKYV